VLEQVDACLESLLRAWVPLSATDVDVSFETPTRDWSARLNRPTVNLFLWDLKRSSEHARTGTERFERNGMGMQRIAPPILDLRYMVSAWTQDHRDERALLSGLLRSVLRAQQVPEGFLTPELADEGVHVRLASSDDPQVDAYKIIDNTMKATLDVGVSIAFDLDLAEELAAAVTDIGVRVEDRDEPERRQVIRRVAGETSRDAAGALVVSPRGSAVVDETGRFLVRAAAGDQLVVHADPPRTVVVPEIGGVIVG
jgi:Pvc16 N-terminal domain